MPKFSSTQFELPEDLARLVREFAADIPDGELAEDGREDTPHVTVKYGLHTTDVDDLLAALGSNFGPVTVRLGKTSIFAGDEFDVLKIDIEKSPDLFALNRFLSDNLDHTTTHPDYKPHVTIAYLNPGEGEKYAGDDFLNGQEFQFNQLIFSTSDGVRHSIYLADGQEAKSIPNSQAGKGTYMEDIVISLFPGELKSLGNGKYAGFLVLFSDEKTPDLSGDFFTKSTEFFIDNKAALPILYDHGTDSVLKRRKIGTGTVTKTDEGLWLEFQLARRDKYEKMIDKMCLAGKAGLSSGAAGHLVSRQPVKGAHWVAEWGLAEASVTPESCEPRIASVMPVKSYAESRTPFTFEDVQQLGPLPSRLNKYLDDLVDSGKDLKTLVALMAKESGMSIKAVEAVLAGALKPSEAKLKGFARALDVDEETLRASSSFSAKTIRGMFEEELAEKTPSVWELWNAYCSVTQKLAMATASNKAAGVDFDLDSKLSEATAEYVDRLKSQVVSQIESFVDEGKFDEPFYLKAIIELSEGDLLSAKHLDIEQHSDLVVSAMKEITARYRANHEARRNQKAGRVLSQRNRTRLMTMLEQIKAAVTDCQVMLDESQPMASDEAKRAAKAKLLRSKWNAKKSGVK
jgi:2'-5' RNA ligase/transcriptional regulator with XRE-family HTH domain